MMDIQSGGKPVTWDCGTSSCPTILSAIDEDTFAEFKSQHVIVVTMPAQSQTLNADGKGFTLIFDMSSDVTSSVEVDLFVAGPDGAHGIQVSQAGDTLTATITDGAHEMQAIAHHLITPFRSTWAVKYVPCPGPSHVMSVPTYARFCLGQRLVSWMLSPFQMCSAKLISV
jgi:hypothetical protein